MTTTSTQPATSGSPAAGDERPGCTPAGRITRSLLGWGVLAGPFFVVVSLSQAATRDGFDLTRHDWSLLAVGAYGWIQVANFVLTGLMVLAGAIGFGRAMTSGVGARWAPRLLAAYGAALISAGLFRADPMRGFPLGTPDGPPVNPSGPGLLHLVFGGLGFLCLVAATGLLAVRLRREGRGPLAGWTALTGGALLVAFAATATGSAAPAPTMAFAVAVVLTWLWLSVLSAQLYRTVS